MKVKYNKKLKTSDTDKRAWLRALSLIPRGTQTMSKCPDQFVDGVHPKFIERGRGSYIYDHDGNGYLDYPMALGPIILGHCDTGVNSAVTKQMEKGACFSLPSRLESDLAQLVVDCVPCAEQVRFAKNGTDANLGAVRIARSYTKREHIVCCGYHGWGDWYASSTERDHGVPSSLKRFVHHFKYNDLKDLESKLERHSVAAVIMEACALTKPADGFLEGVKELTSKYGTVLIFDEIVTGFRWSLGGAQERYGVIPDLCTVGKSMANGFPISAVCGKEEIMQEFNHCFFSSTFGGELLSISAAIATISIIKEKDYSHIWDLGSMLHEGIISAANEIGIKISLQGEAPRHHIEFVQKDGSYNSLAKDVFYQEMIKRGILWGNVIYITFAHSVEDIEYTILCAKDAFQIVNQGILENDLESCLDGERSVDIFRKNV